MPSTRREILPFSMHTAWAGSNRYKISELMSFTAETPLPVDSPSRPSCVRFNEPLRRHRQHYGFTSTYGLAATLDTEPLAKTDSYGNLTRLPANHFQSARALPGYSASFHFSSKARKTICISIPAENSSRCSRSPLVLGLRFENCEVEGEVGTLGFEI
jgi:hypothetical protein